jgi:chromatin segregation and condensation protein Rec8/ScpA/Scc1 (kleisin family)
VRLSSFQGPLDLLLFLIRRAEVDITEIPIREIRAAVDFEKHLLAA